MSSNTKFIDDCRVRLIQKKEELLNKMTESGGELSHFVESGGDEVDQAVRLLKEGEFLKMNERLQFQLGEIERALSRIEEGSYGICEVTGEHIEPARLKAIPWTSCSIEGAEIKESMGRKYANK